MVQQIDSNTSSTSSNTKPAGTLRGGFMLVLVVKPQVSQDDFDLILRAADMQKLRVYNRSDPKKNTLVFLTEDPENRGIFQFKLPEGVGYDRESFFPQLQSSRELWKNQDETASRVAIADLERRTIKPFASEDHISEEHREAGVLSRHGHTEGMVVVTSSGFLDASGELLTHDVGWQIEICEVTRIHVKVDMRQIPKQNLWDPEIFGEMIEASHADIRMVLKKNADRAKKGVPPAPIEEEEPNDNVGNRAGVDTKPVAPTPPRRHLVGNGGRKLFEDRYGNR